MTSIISDITKLVGNTPLLRLGNISKDIGADILIKLESFNPCSSVKDRIALNMIRTAEQDHSIDKGTTIVEPTSGNTGIGLAFVCASRGYPLILTMPDTMSIERRKLLMALGAQLVLTPGSEGMKGAIAKAEELAQKNENHVVLGQFTNPANPMIHYQTTGPEIWNATGGNVDIFVSGVGTGGTISGVSKFLKEQKRPIWSIAVEPKESPVISGGEPGPHKIQGIGAGFIPQVLDKTVVDEVITMDHKEAGKMSRRLAAQEGLLVGISTGANVAAALQVAARQDNQGKTIVTIACDTGERYLSTGLFKD